MAIMLAYLVLATADVDALPSLTDWDRFPPLVLVNSQLGFLIESRFNHQEQARPAAAPG